MNFVLTILLFFILGLAQGVPVGEARLGDIQPDSPAEAAGLLHGDEILAIDGTSISEWIEFQTIVRDHPEQELALLVDRSGQQIEIHVTPKAERIEEF